MSQFQREVRYVVVKIKDIHAAGCTQEEIVAFNAICDKVARHRIASGKPLLECLVVESDWPEYEPTWAAIEKRMTGEKVCPHAAPFKYCQRCVSNPCPIGLDKKGGAA